MRPWQAELVEDLIDRPGSTGKVLRERALL
jgi:hypothetical protein